MFSKRGRGYDDEDVPEEKRFRKNMADCFLTGGLSGQRAQSLFNDAQAAGASDVADLQGPSKASHASRNLLRRLSRRTKWPKEYVSYIRVKNPKTEEVQ
jgi:hypothetical protein